MNMDYEGAAEIERAWREGLTPDPLLKRFLLGVFASQSGVGLV